MQDQSDKYPASTEVWQEDELVSLQNNQHPMTSQEIAQSEFFGSWSDLDIRDSMEWIHGQRQQSGRNYSW